jgi:hypothetical protein
MHADTQRLLDHRSAPATALRCAAWVNLDIRSTSIFRFVARIGGELLPGGVSNAFRQEVIFQHPCDAQVLENDHAETIDQLPAFLMREVLTPVGYPLMDASNNHPTPRSFWSSLRLFAQAALRSLQVALIAPKEARVVYRLASRERGKLLKTDIYTNSRFRHVGGLLTRFFDRKGNKSLAGTTMPKCDGFDSAFDGTVEVDRYLADLREDQLVFFEPRAVPVLRVGHTVVSTRALEARVSGVLFTDFDTAKERLECQIDTNLSVLQDLAMHQFERLALGFPIGKHRLSVVQ